MFEPAETEFSKSIFKKPGGHYNIHSTEGLDGMKFLRQWFPDGNACEYAFAVFSTSGVHGSYTTIEQIEASLAKYGDDASFLENDDDEMWPEDYHGCELTFLVVEPRIVKTTYGNATVTLADIPFLKALRASSWLAVRNLGTSEPVASI